ncbi:hypothetical protein OAF37_02205 [Rubripirellula sp.]|nr:hypothetical protein [Rubripirellula sp.]MDB4644848.1 hypothetical protein [Rubripirellula sp.]
MPTFGRRGDEAFSASWLLMLDLPPTDRPSSVGMSVKAQGGRRGTHRLCTSRSFAAVGSTSVMGTAIESKLRDVVPRLVTEILEPVTG